MTEILFARKIDVDALNAAIAGTVATLATADFITGTVQGGLGAERVATASTSVIPNIATGGQITWERAALTGDITAAQNNNATTLATVNANVGSFGLAASVPQFTVNAKGLITAAANVSISITSAAVSDFTEAAQDAVGAALGNTTTINHTYNDGANTITADVNTNSIGNTQLRQGLARSVIGVTGNVTANVADIQGTADQVLVVNGAGTALAFGTVATGGITAAAVTYAKIQNVSATSRMLGRKTAGAGSTEELTLSEALDFVGSAANGDILYRTAGAWARLPIGSNTNVLTVASSLPSWAAASAGSGTVTRRTISGADTAGLTDKGNLIEVTSGSFTLAFTAAATLTNGWWSYIYNHGTGDVILDPNGAEQIDGLTTWVLYPGGAVLVQTDGTSFHSILLAPMRKQFDTSGANTFTKPGVGTFARIEGWAAGGSGGSTTATNHGGGGGGGGYLDRTFPLSTFGTTETVTVGAGGVAVNNANGNVGGNTTVGSFFSIFGGGGGGGGAVISAGGAGGGALSAGGTAAGGTVGAASNPRFQTTNISTFAFGGLFGGPAGGSTGAAGTDSVFAGAGGAGGVNNASAGLAGGNSLWGGAGGGSSGGIGNGAGGTSVHGGNGGAANNGAGVATTGTQPGGGGGGSETGNSGAGGAGRVIIYVW